MGQCKLKSVLQCHQVLLTRVVNLAWFFDIADIYDKMSTQQYFDQSYNDIVKALTSAVSRTSD